MGSSTKEHNLMKPYTRERKNSISEISDNEDELLEYHRWQREERLREQEMEKLVSDWPFKYDFKVDLRKTSGCSSSPHLDADVSFGSEVVKKIFAGLVWSSMTVMFTLYPGYGQNLCIQNFYSPQIYFLPFRRKTFQQG